MNEVIEMGFIEKEDNKKHQSNIVYSDEGIAPCICAGCGVKYWINIMEEQCGKQFAE